MTYLQKLEDAYVALTALERNPHAQVRDKRVASTVLSFCSKLYSRHVSERNKLPETIGPIARRNSKALDRLKELRVELRNLIKWLEQEGALDEQAKRQLAKEEDLS